MSVPVEAEVIGWRVPDPLAFQTLVALEQSPYGVAKHYGVEPWSEEHFRLLDGSFRQLARVGNDLLFVPCIQNTEFGNFEDTPIRWLRRRDGSLAFDYRILDRYLDLAVAEKGPGAFSAKHPEGRSGKRLLAQFCSARELLGADVK